MTPDGDMVDLVGRIYDCAFDPRAWPDTLQGIAQAACADGAALRLIDPATQEFKLAAAWDLGREAGRALRQAVSADPVLTASRFAPCEPYTAASHLGEEDYRSSRFYREAMAPFGYDDAIITVLVRSPSRFGALILPRKAVTGPIADAQLEPVRLLAPHVRRSVMMTDMLGAEALREEMLSASLDLLTVGVILVDGAARIVHANRAGLRHLDDARAVRRSAGHLSARNPAAAAALKEAIAKATQAGTPGDLDQTGIAVPISGCDGCDLAAWVLPLGSAPRVEFDVTYPAKAAVFLRRIGDTAPLSHELLARHYGITPAECRVLALLAQGLSPHEAARALGCSEPTVRTHLQHLFLKTGTRGQPDLVRLAASALAPASTQAPARKRQARSPCRTDCEEGASG